MDELCIMKILFADDFFNVALQLFQCVGDDINSATVLVNKSCLARYRPSTHSNKGTAPNKETRMPQEVRLPESDEPVSISGNFLLIYICLKSFTIDLHM